ncbi:MAG: protein-glutamate O-methyltransferase CheR [Gammaproteobacteria bacterium]|nr:protein-glutamate O-methyltransferase CheR [Gammaproteobacteria bacterium]
MPATPANKLDLAPFKKLIKARTGLRFEGQNEILLMQNLLKRYALIDVDASRYLNKLQTDSHEFQQLINLLTINETYFYREPSQLQLLTDFLIPRLYEQRGDNRAPLRILCAGCSSGEEPYSVLMALHQCYGDTIATRFQVIGGDIDEMALAKARAGRYRRFSFRLLPEALQERYFSQEEDEFVVAAKLRDQPQFHHLNLLADSYPQPFHHVDIIFFRNVSIYFDITHRHQIITQLARLLNPHGILLTGITESLANDFGILHLHQHQNNFYFSRETGHAPSWQQSHRPAAPQRVTPLPDLTQPDITRPDLTRLPPLPIPMATPAAVASAPQQPTAAPAPPPRQEGAPSDATLRQLFFTKRYKELQQGIEAAKKEGRTALPLLQLQAAMLFNQKQMAEAEIAAQAALTEDRWALDTLLLLGQICRWKNLPEEALHWYQQVIYVAPANWLAHYLMADIFNNRGQSQRAEREYRLTLKQLKLIISGQSSNPELLSLQLLAIPLEQIAYLCECNLKRLSEEQP